MPTFDKSVILANLSPEDKFYSREKHLNNDRKLTHVSNFKSPLKTMKENQLDYTARFQRARINSSDTRMNFQTRANRNSDEFIGPVLNNVAQNLNSSMMTNGKTSSNLGLMGKHRQSALIMTDQSNDFEVESRDFQEQESL